MQALHDPRIREVQPMLEQVQAHHQADGLGIAAQPMVIRAQRLADRLPVDLARQDQQVMGGIQHCCTIQPHMVV